MNNEIKEVINKMKLQYYKKKNINLDNNEICLLLDYMNSLQEKISQYENPEDMTLFYMWLDERAKDKMKALQEENETLNAQLDFIGEQNKYIEKLLKICSDYDKEVNRLKEEYVLLQNASDEYEDELQERIDKAVEYLEQPYRDNFDFSKVELLNILNGGDE